MSFAIFFVPTLPDYPSFLYNDSSYHRVRRSKTASFFCKL